MTTAAQPGLGAHLQVSIATVFTTVGQMQDLDGPGMEVGQRETTHLLSSIKTYAPTIGDSGEVSGSILYDPQDAVHKLLFGRIAAPAIDAWKLIFADTNGPTTYAFSGFLTGFKPGGIDVEGNLMADITIKVSGAITVTP